MFCTKCGIELKERDKFCCECGNPTGRGSSAPDNWLYPHTRTSNNFHEISTRCLPCEGSSTSAA